MIIDNDWQRLYFKRYDLAYIKMSPSFPGDISALLAEKLISVCLCNKCLFYIFLDMIVRNNNFYRRII